LLITGYAENAVLNHDHLDRGIYAITKPFAAVEERGSADLTGDKIRS
jgi:hypothetical protein